MKKAIGRYLPAAAAVLCFLVVLTGAPAAQEGVRDGLTLSLRMAIPALFPFFLTAGLLTGTGVTAALGRLFRRPLSALYGLPGEAAGPLLLGLTGGYPIGAASTAALYRAGSLRREEAERLLGFCNNTGPAFLVGVCGAGLLGSAQTGLVLYAVHVLSALITGLAMTSSGPVRRQAARPALAIPKERFPVLFTRVVGESFSTCLAVAGFITAFSVVRALLVQSGALTLLSHLLALVCTALGLPADLASPFLTGMLEMTCGLALLPELHLPMRLLLPVMSALTAFGGLSVWGQTMSAVAGTDLRLWRCFLGKCLHAALAATLAAIWCALRPRALPAFAAEGALPLLPSWTVLFPAFIILLTFTYGKLRRSRV